MKISKSILESIIRQIIREQEEDVEPSETDIQNAYASFLQAAQTRAWGKAVSELTAKLTMGILEKATRSGTLSITEFNAVAAKTFSNGRVRDLVKGISDQALEASTIYQESSDASKRIARTSFHRFVDAAIGSIVASEIIFCILYDMKDIDGMADVIENEWDPYQSTRFAILRGHPVIHSPPKLVDNTEIKAAIDSGRHIGAATKKAWEAIMRFVAQTTYKENAHLAPAEKHFTAVDPNFDLVWIYEKRPPF